MGLLGKGLPTFRREPVEGARLVPPPVVVTVDSGRSACAQATHISSNLCRGREKNKDKA